MIFFNVSIAIGVAVCGPSDEVMMIPVKEVGLHVKICSKPFHKSYSRPILTRADRHRIVFIILVAYGPA